MPYAAPSRCAEPACTVLTTAGRCDEHKRPAWHNPSAWSSVTGADRIRWRRRREQHLQDNPLCVVCGLVAEEADHVVELADGGDLLTGPLQSFCSFHHREKSRASSKARAIARARAARAARAAEALADGGIPEE